MLFAALKQAVAIGNIPGDFNQSELWKLRPCKELAGLLIKHKFNVDHLPMYELIDNFSFSLH